MSVDWDAYFAGVVNAVSQKPKYTKVNIGAIIVNDDKLILSSGYNSVIRNCDVELHKLIREKDIYIEHAERNAIFNAAREGIRLKGSTLYCTWYPCMKCARAIIQVGIKHVVSLTEIKDCPTKWSSSLIRGKQLLEECCVTTRYYDENNTVLDNMIKPSNPWERE